MVQLLDITASDIGGSQVQLVIVTVGVLINRLAFARQAPSPDAEIRGSHPIERSMFFCKTPRPRRMSRLKFITSRLHSMHRRVLNLPRLAKFYAQLGVYDELEHMTRFLYPMLPKYSPKQLVLTVHAFGIAKVQDKCRAFAARCSIGCLLIALSRVQQHRCVLLSFGMGGVGARGISTEQLRSWYVVRWALCAQQTKGGGRMASPCNSVVGVADRCAQACRVLVRELQRAVNDVHSQLGSRTVWLP